LFGSSRQLCDSVTILSLRDVRFPTEMQYTKVKNDKIKQCLWTCIHTYIQLKFANALLTEQTDPLAAAISR